MKHLYTSGEIICICNKWIDSDDIPITPIVNNIYTVTDARLFKDGPYYQLQGIPVTQGGNECWWSAAGFVTLDTFKEKELQKELAEIFL